MAFAIPIMKKEYSLYANTSAPKQRRTSENVDGNRRTNSESRRKIKSSDPILSNSPSPGITLGSVPRTKPIELKRVRSAAPVLFPGSVQTTPLHQKNPKPSTVRPSTSAPTGDAAVYSPSRSSKSSSSSSSSETTGALGKFHSRLITRLRKTLRIKDPEPTST